MLLLSTIHRSTLSACRCASILNKSTNFSFRNYSNEKLEDKPEKPLNAMKELEENYNAVYRFPKIRIAAAANKLKNFHGIVTLLGLPGSYFCKKNFC
jgi:hypothetical protein